MLVKDWKNFYKSLGGKLKGSGYEFLDSEHATDLRGGREDYLLIRHGGQIYFTGVTCVIQSQQIVSAHPQEWVRITNKTRIDEIGPIAELPHADEPTASQLKQALISACGSLFESARSP